MVLDAPTGVHNLMRRESTNCACQQSGLILCCLITICLVLSPTTIKAQLRAMGKCTTFRHQVTGIRHRVHKAAKPGRKERGRWVGRKQSTSPNQQATEARVGGWAKTIDKPDMTKHTSLPPGPIQSSHSSPRVPVTSTPRTALRIANPFV